MPFFVCSWWWRWPKAPRRLMKLTMTWRRLRLELGIERFFFLDSNLEIFTVRFGGDRWFGRFCHKQWRGWRGCAAGVETSQRAKSVAKFILIWKMHRSLCNAHIILRFDCSAHQNFCFMKPLWIGVRLIKLPLLDPP